MGNAFRLSAVIELLLLFSVPATGSDDFLVGAGIYDMTGPSSQINMMGYAKAGQTAHGIHQRLRARAFVIAATPGRSEDDRLVPNEGAADVLEMERSRLRWRTGKNHSAVDAAHLGYRRQPQLAPDPSETICFVSIDAGMGSDLLNYRVLQRMEQLIPSLPGQTRPLCHLENLSISGTHTHSAPAGFIQYALYQITSLGFSEEVMDSYVEGIAQALYRAYSNLQPASVDVTQDMLWDANVNRSPSSYLLNPQSERTDYTKEGNTDKRMLQLNFFAKNSSKPLGLLNWFAVHGTSMNSSNTLLSGDNKGYASYLAERHVNGNSTMPGTGDFVAAFASTNLGDVSPNIDGPRCIDTGLPCDFTKSTCDGKTQLCIASGPGKNMFESTEIIGRRQYQLAMTLLTQANDRSKLTGVVDFRHSFVDMSALNVTLESGQVVRTCPAALGYAFAGGTTDGPGDFDFTQGTNTSNPFWNMIGGFLSIPSPEQSECQFPKPILLNTGRASLPYDWDPNTIPISIFRVGRLFILNVPAEFTTMAGRRLRKAVRDVVIASGQVENPLLSIAGLSNSYAHYVTTIEEYAGQRYEAASTLYGPHTLSAYIQEFRRIASDLLSGQTSSTGERPKDLSKYQLSLIEPVWFDTIGLGAKFGSVSRDANSSYIRGRDSVVVRFRSANPRHNQRIEGTFLTVDMLDEESDTWVTRYVDGDWCTKFYWRGGSFEYWGSSFAEIHWDIPPDEPRGLYRVCHYGTRKTLLGFAEAFLYHAPGWLKSNMFGSYAVSIALGAIELAITLSESLRRWLAKVGDPRFQDFHGCTSTFVLVHGK